MFERYTEKARRVIFFARYEASQFGSPVIDAEHLLLGLIRKSLASAFDGFPRGNRMPSAEQSGIGPNADRPFRPVSIYR
jgi:hypothetical protein